MWLAKSIEGFVSTKLHQQTGSLSHCKWQANPLIILWKVDGKIQTVPKVEQNATQSDIKIYRIST